MYQAAGLADAGLMALHPPPCGGHSGAADHLRSCGDVDHALCRESWRNCEQACRSPVVKRRAMRCCARELLWSVGGTTAASVQLAYSLQRPRQGHHYCTALLRPAGCAFAKPTVPASSYLPDCLSRQRPWRSQTHLSAAAQVPTAMLADVLGALNFPRLLEATRDADPPLMGPTAEAASLRRVAALAGVWEAAAAADKAQVLPCAESHRRPIVQSC